MLILCSCGAAIRAEPASCAKGFKLIDEFTNSALDGTHCPDCYRDLVLADHYPEERERIAESLYRYSGDIG